MTDLAKRAVASPHWRWMPGMLAADTGLRLDEMTTDWEGERPDLTDPATLGCLLALVREALGIPYLCTSVSPEGRWWVDGYSLHDTEAEALVVALEAAP
jgi:hypothetical protein